MCSRSLIGGQGFAVKRGKLDPGCLPFLCDTSHRSPSPPAERHAPGPLCLNTARSGKRDGQSASLPIAHLIQAPIMGQDTNTPKSASRVNLDHFDPDGVRELSRTLSQSSMQARRKSVRSDNTLASEQPFSLERTLHAALDKYVPLDSPRHGWRLTTLIDNMVLISRGGSSAFTSRTFALLALAPPRLTRKPSDLCSTPRLFGGGAEVHSARQQG